MYKGLIEAIGVVEKIVERHGSKDFTIRAPEVLVDCQLGDSLGINGVCLTVTEFDDQTFKATAVPETLEKTNLNELKEGDLVNIERSMQASARIGGHLVQGHVDTKIKILDIQVDGEAWNISFSLPTELAPYVVNKGFVGLDGMSITVVERCAD